MKSTVLMVGESVIGKARTPKLWNLAFKQLGIENEVTELDYSLQESSEIDRLLDRYFTLILAYPNKIVASRLPTQQKLDSRLTGYNIVSWDAILGRYQGYNFDGISFCKSLKSKFPEVSDLPVQLFILGTGSTAHSFLFKAKEDLNVAASVMISRNPSKVNTINSATHSVTNLDNLEVDRQNETLKILVNASPVGKTGYEANSTLTNLLDLAQFDLVFDFNYGENYQSPFAALVSSSNFLDGDEANVIQAALGFCLTQAPRDFLESEIIEFFTKLRREI